MLKRKFREERYRVEDVRGESKEIREPKTVGLLATVMWQGDLQRDVSYESRRARRWTRTFGTWIVERK